MGPNLNIFTIYTLEDSAAVEQVLHHLKPFKESHKLTIWQDDPIRAGQQWKPQIESRFQETDIFILFLSTTFMHSQFVQQLEFKMLIDRYKAGTSKVIPILLENCPWDIDFEADEYTFSFKELDVLPEAGKPVKQWDSSEDAHNNVAASIKNVINLLSKEELQDEVEKEEAKKEEVEKIEVAKSEEQMAISFDEGNKDQEKDRVQKDIATKKIAFEKRQKEENEARLRAATEKKNQEEVASKKIEEEQRIKNLTEIKRRAQKKRQEAEAELKRKTEQEKKQQKEKQQEEKRKAFVAESKSENEKSQPVQATGLKKQMLIGAVLTVLAIVAIWAFKTNADKQVEPLPNTKVVEVEDSIPTDKIEMEQIVEKESLSELIVGDSYNGGMIFTIDSESKSGKIVHTEDAGPMTWKNAIKIHEQLGEGWYLPTLEELKLIRKTVGQGADNTAEFSNGVYWSATPYDTHQARLLRFRDGNTSYHYNKEAEHRKYRVRAVQSFSR